MADSFSRMATRTCSVKRSPSIVNGKRGIPEVIHADIPCTPLDPISRELAQRYLLQTPVDMYVTYLNADYDIDEGDFLVMDGMDLPVKAASKWDFRNAKHLEVVVEKQKNG
jgi:hypothetical protein